MIKKLRVQGIQGIKEIQRVLFLVLLAVSTMFAYTNSQVNKNTQEYNKYAQVFSNKSPHNLALLISNSMAKNLPQKVDYITTIASSIAYNNTITLTLKVSLKDFKKRYPNTPIKKFSREQLKLFNSILIKMQSKKVSETLCIDPGLRAVINRGVTYEYDLSYEDNSPIGHFEVTKDTCKNIPFN